MKTMLDKVYDGNSVNDINEDVSDAFDEQLSSVAKEIPRDEYNFHKGTFRVVITWEPGE